MDRDPYHHVPPDFQERSKSWRVSAENLIIESAPYIYMSVENLMFAERPILQMEKTLARHGGSSPDPREPWLLKECGAQSILWVCGLYEVTRTLKDVKFPKCPALGDLYEKLHVLRIPLAKHEVMRVARAKCEVSGHRKQPHAPPPHYPTSVWSVETGRVGWSIFNPNAKLFEEYFRSDLADEFLAATGVNRGT
jgi:hypothetical protein